MSSQEHKLALPCGTVLQQYKIESVLGYGGFGIVYKARHTHLDTLVAIKEYLPQQCATREGSTVHPISLSEEKEFDEGIGKFLEEAKQLVQFDDHPNIIRCKDFFKENGTAYLVMNLEQGNELAQVLRNHHHNETPLSEEQIIDLIIPVLEGLKYIHGKGVLHRDIKPSNIFVRSKDGQPLLIDFGAAKQDFGNVQKSVNQSHTYGYAPLEQVSSEGELGPWTDIHAVGAMMWRIVLNANPPRVEDRISKVSRNQPDPIITAVQEVSSEYSASFINAIIKALSIHNEDRFQTADEFISALQGGQLSENEPVTVAVKKVTQQPLSSATLTPSQPQVSTSTTKIEPEVAQDDTAKSNKAIIWVASFGGLAALIILMLNLFDFIGNDERPTKEVIFSKLEIIYEQVTEAQLAIDLNNGDLSTISALRETIRGLDNPDKETINLIKLLESGVQKRKVSVEKNMSRARERTFELAKFHQQWSSHIETLCDEKRKVAEDNGNYDKAEFISGLKKVVIDASKLSTEKEVKQLIAKRIKI